MDINLLFFAAARERAGTGQARLSLPDWATLADAIAAAGARWPALVPLWPHVRFAVDEAFVADRGTPLGADSTVAVIPPVSGGHPRVALTHEPLDPRAVERLVAGPDRGGLVTFTGTVRDHTGDHGVVRLEYEAYEPMAVKVLADIVTRVEARWPATTAAVHHRLGVLAVGEAAVVLAVSAPHRADAFAACQALIDELKADVPIFKKEVRGDGSVWVGLGP
ncbi:MAG: molybdenum cofactor biosynthesis protein MoaE [Myxococcales bacterium]|nr:molybdenum cofactor biosynthesis protein MoaE [Myxococcales bacterium]